MKLEGKYASRKFWLAQQILLLTVGVPLLFARVGIASEVTMLVLGVIASVGAFYGVANVMAKKYGGPDAE